MIKKSSSAHCVGWNLKLETKSEKLLKERFRFVQTVSKSLEQKSRDAKLDFASTTTENKFQGFFIEFFFNKKIF